MTRVLFLTESFHPVLGGGETHSRQLGGRLVAMGHEATVVTRRGEVGWPAKEEVDGIRVRRVPPSGPGRTGKYLMVPAALRAVLREGRRHDVLVVRGTRVLGMPGLVAARALGRPAILQPEINGELSGEAFAWGWRRGKALEPAIRALADGEIRPEETIGGRFPLERFEEAFELAAEPTDPARRKVLFEIS